MAPEPELVMYKPYVRETSEPGVKKPWPKMPAKPKLEPRRTNHLPLRISADERKSNLEVLSRRGGGTTYRTPEAGRSTRGKGITTDDLSHALGLVKDPLEQLLADALSSHNDSAWKEVLRLAAPVLLKQLQGSHNTRSMVSGDKKYRARLILHDVFHDLVLERPPRHASISAKLLKMRARDYRKLYKSAAGFIETVAQAGAFTAIKVLYGRG